MSKDTDRRDSIRNFERVHARPTPTSYSLSAPQPARKTQRICPMEQSSLAKRAALPPFNCWLVSLKKTGRPFRLLSVVDEYTRECLAIDVERQADSMRVLERLAALFVERGVPDYIRSDNGSEFTARLVRNWLERVGVKTLFIELGSPWEKRVCRIVEREVSRRVSQWRDLLHLAGSEGVDGGMATGV